MLSNSQWQANQLRVTCAFSYFFVTFPVAISAAFGSTPRVTFSLLFHYFNFLGYSESSCGTFCPSQRKHTTFSVQSFNQATLPKSWICLRRKSWTSAPRSGLPFWFANRELDFLISTLLHPGVNVLIFRRKFGPKSLCLNVDCTFPDKG